MSQQLAELHQQLSEAQKRNDYLAARAAELDVQLDETSMDLQAAKLAGGNSEESSQLARENELLRNIVVRERQEEARRDEARNLVLAELSKLKIRSETLNRQIEFLAQPVTKLSSEELALFRQPVVSVSDQRAGLFKASFVFEKKSGMNSIGAAKTDANAKSGGDSDARMNRPEPSKTDLPPKVRDGVRRVLEQPTLVAQGPAEVFRARASFYRWLLDHPDRAVQMWHRLGARCITIRERGAGKFGWADGQGTDISWQTIHSAPGM